MVTGLNLNSVLVTDSFGFHPQTTYLGENPTTTTNIRTEKNNLSPIWDAHHFNIKVGKELMMSLLQM